MNNSVKVRGFTPFEGENNLTLEKQTVSTSYGDSTYYPRKMHLQWML